MLFKKVIFMLASALVLEFLCLTLANSQEGTGTLPLRMMFYNVENMFDILDDPLTEDDEFLPDGLRRWNGSRYNKKSNSVYKTIIAAGEWSPPAIVGFSEIENRKVLEDLVYGTGLSNFNYGIIHGESPDPRGIDVCMIFRKDIVRVIEYKLWTPHSVDKNDFHSRNVLYVKCAIMLDTIHFMINHWPSKRGGVLPGEPVRKAIAMMVSNAADSISNLIPGKSKIIVMGDFNSDPDDSAIQTLVNQSEYGGAHLINMAKGYKSNASGTYRYMGAWEMLDQIFISEGLLDCITGIYADPAGFRIFKPDFLLKKDPKYPGLTTFSTYRGYRYQGGFSDHLPVLLDLGVR
jgi:hypothetical protein